MTDLVKKALRDSLAAFLETQLVGAHPGIVCSGEWPTPNSPLPAKAITVVTPGEPVTAYHPTVAHAITPTTGVNANVTYTYGWIEQGIQLDCWATFREVRDILAHDVEAAINQPPAITLGLSGLLPNWSRRGGLVIRLPDLFNVPADFYFKPQPRQDENSDAAQEGEWRATWTGTASLHAVNQEEVPLLKQLIFKINGESHS